jgi:hypothetical protein
LQPTLHSQPSRHFKRCFRTDWGFHDGFLGRLRSNPQERCKKGVCFSLPYSILTYSHTAPANCSPTAQSLSLRDFIVNHV